VFGCWIILSVFILYRQQVVSTKDHTFCCLFQHVSATTSTQRGTVRRARAAANAALNSLHLTVTVAVLATLVIPNVDLANVTSMGPGVFTVNLVVGSAPANQIMLGGFAISVTMDTTNSLSASVSHFITNFLVLYLHYYNMVPFFVSTFRKQLQLR
jgi:hypothetical protein